MDEELGRLIDLDTPKINPLIGNGLATYHMKEAAKYIDDVWRSVAKDYPAGLVFHGGTRCTPPEEFAEQTKKRANKAGKSGSRRTYDISESNLFMMRYSHSYKGVPLDDRFMFLPYVKDAGRLTLSGSDWYISPVLVDRVISVGISTVFVQLNKTRLIFKRLGHRFLMGDVEEPVQVVWSKVHQGNRTNRSVKAVTTMMHYLLCKYGFTETFSLFGNCHPVVLRDDTDMSQFPNDEWVICRSSAIRLLKAGRAKYERSNLRLAVKRSELTQKVVSMLGGLFYVVDHFPTRALPEHMESKRMWMTFLGELIPGESDHVGHLHDEAEKHLRSLDKYIDTLTDEKLKNIDLPVDNIYELFSIIIGKYNDWLLGGADKVASMYDKEFSILFYALYNITSAINNLYFRLKAAEEKAMKGGKELTKENIEGIMFDLLKTGLIFNINKGHGEVSTISTPGDNKAFKTTAILVSQSNSNQQSPNRDRASTNDPNRYLHGSIAEVGGVWNLPKSSPYGRDRVNPTVRMDKNWVVLRKPEFVPLIDGVQEKIRRR